MISGQRGLASIEQALRDIEREEAEARKLSERETQSRAENEKTLTDSYRDLARVKVDVSLEDGVIDQADGLTAEVMEHLSRWLATRRAAEARWEALKAESEDWRGKRHAAHEEAERAREEYDQAFATARQALSGEEGHAALLKARDEAREHIENARAKAAKAEAERAEKEQPYAADPLFMYLWQRQYGTAAYAATGITRMLDGWVARLIGYGEARVNFAALTEIPKRLTQYVGRLEESAARAEAAIEANVHEAVTRKAGRDLAAGIAALEQRLAEAETAVSEREAAFDQLSDEIARLANGEDENLAAAIEALSKNLASTGFRQLVAEAQRTATPHDDNVLARIQNAAGQIDRIDARAEERRGQIDALAARRSDLLRIAAEFRRQRYDDSSSVFSKDELFGDLLRQLLAGAITAGHYWKELQRHQNRQRRASDRFPRYDDVVLGPGGGMSWPRFPQGGRWGGGGSWGGGLSLPGGPLPGGGRSGGISIPSGGGRFRTGGSF
jgi:uncharacterized coiled-coil protein SlyX